MSLRCSVQVRIEGLSDTQSSTVMDALSPDNTSMPKGLAVAMRDEEQAGQGDKLRTLIIECTGDEGSLDKRGSGASRVMGHLVGTIDEVLEHVQVSLKVMDRDA